MEQGREDPPGSAAGDLFDRWLSHTGRAPAPAPFEEPASDAEPEGEPEPETPGPEAEPEPEAEAEAEAEPEAEPATDPLFGEWFAPDHEEPTVVGRDLEVALGVSPRATGPAVPEPAAESAGATEVAAPEPTPEPASETEPPPGARAEPVPETEPPPAGTVQPAPETEPPPAATPQPAPEPAPPAPEHPTAAEVPPIVEFPPRTGVRRLTGLLLLACLAATAVASWAAYTDRRETTIAVAVTFGVLTLVVWAVRAGTTVTRMTVRGGQLEVHRSDGRFVFDLTSRYTPVEVVGRPGRRGWRVLFLRRGMSPFVVDSSMVDPHEFMTVLHHYRRE